MPITKDGNGTIVETPILDNDQFIRTGVIHDDSFALCDEKDRLKQIRFNATPLGTNSHLTLVAPVTAADSSVLITFPSTSGTLVTSTGIGSSFTTIQTPAGTYPVATSPTDTLTFTSSNNSVTITGNSTTDTIDFTATAVAGSDTQVQYNDSGVLAGDSNFVWNKTADALGVQTTPQTPLHVNSTTGTGINDVVSGSAALVDETLPAVPTGSISQIAEFAAPSTGGVSQDLGGSGFIANGQTFDYRFTWLIQVGGAYYASGNNQVVSYTDTINDATTAFANSITWSGAPAEVSHVLIERQVNGGGYNDSTIVAVGSSPFSDGNFSGTGSTNSWPSYYQDSTTTPADHSSPSASAIDIGSGNLAELGIIVLMEVKNAMTVNGTTYTSSTAVSSNFDDTGTVNYNAQISWTDGGGGNESVVRMSRDSGITWTYKLVGNSTGPYTFTDESNDSTAETAWGNSFSNYTGTSYTFRVHGRGTGGSGSPAGATIYSPTYNTYSTTIAPGGTKYILKHDLSSVPAGGYKALAPDSSPAYGFEAGQADEPFYDIGYPTSFTNGTTVTPNSYGFSGTNQNRSYRIYSSASGIYSVTPLTVTTTASGGTKYVSLSWSLPSGVSTVKILRSINGGAYDAAKIVTGTSTTDDSTGGNWNESTTVTPTSLVPNAVRIDRANASVSDGVNLEIVNTVGSGTRYSTLGFGVAADTNSPSTLQTFIQSNSANGYLSVVAGQLEGYGSRGGTNLFRFGANNDINLNKSSSSSTNLWAGATPGTPALKVDHSTGNVTIYNTAPSSSDTFSINQRTASTVGLAVRQNTSSPGANLVEYRANTGGITGAITPTGRWQSAAGTSASDPGLRFTGNSTSGFWSITTNTIGIAAGGTEVARWNTTGLSIKDGTPTAKLHIGAGSTSASSAPIKLTSGSLMTSPEVGAIEFLTDNLYYTKTGSTARVVLNASLAIPTSGRVQYAGTGGFLQDSSLLTFSGTRLSPNYISLAAGTATAGTAPLVMTSGTLLTTPIAGAVEFLTDKYYGSITTGPARKEFTLNDAALTSGRVPIVTTNGRLTDDSDLTFATDTLTATKIVAPTSIQVGGGTVITRFDAGTYTPTLTNVANLDASTAYECQYMRVGNTVTVSGKVDVDPTTPATSTQLGISLPIASNLGAVEDCAGTAFASAIASQGAAILGDATNDRAQMQWISGDVTNQPMYFNFTYQVI